MELAKTPLLLNIIVISCEEISLFEWQKLSNSKQRRSYLFEVYIKRMLGRQYNKKQPQPEDKKTMRWLGWLAEQLIKENQTEFLIEKIQPYWLKNQKKKVIYGLIVGLLYGLLYGLNYGLLFGLIKELRYSRLINGLRYSRLINGLINGLIVGLMAGLISGLIGGLIGGLIVPEIEWKKLLIKE